MLSGHQRYAHINSLRGDGVNPALLGMCKDVAPRRRPELSEDAVRRAFIKLDEEAGVAWLQEHMQRAEQDGLPYLFKLRMTAGDPPFFFIRP